MKPLYSAFAAALATLSLAAVPARAAEREVQSISVDYSDLNLSSRAGVNALRHRLISASRDVCAGGDAGQAGAAADRQACREEALQDALRDLRRVVASVPAQHGTALASVLPR